MSQYIKDDNIIRVSESSTLSVTDRLPVGTYVLDFDKRADSFFRYDEDDEEVYGFYRPEYSDLRAVNPDGSVELVILGGALNAFLRRSTFSELNYQQLTSKL